MSIIRRCGAYVAVFLVLLALTALVAGPLWKPLDYVFFRLLQSSDTIELKEDLYLIDVPYYSGTSNSFNRGEFRQRLIGVLKTIEELSVQSKSPEAVILDIFFSSDSVEVESLTSAIDALRKKGVAVYAIFNLANRTESNFDNIEAKHALQIYDHLDGGYLHSEFTEHLGVITYESELLVPRSDPAYDPVRIEALPLHVAVAHGMATTPTQPRSYVLPLGPQESVAAQTYRFAPAENATLPGSFRDSAGNPVQNLNIDKAILLVASLEGDITQDMLGQAGPMHVAWAIDNQRKLTSNARIPLNHTGITLGLALFAALFTALIYGAAFKYIKRLQTSAIILGVLSATLTSLALLGLSAAFLAANRVIPIGLPIAGILFATVLITLFARRFIITGVVEGAGKYDVFISYSRKDGEWVQKNLYEPLSALRKADGSPLSIFYDVKEISFGEAFTARYMWAIVDSTYFVPVFSSNYYGARSHGRNEMDLAAKRRIEGNIIILPVAFSDEVVPEIYNGLNYVNVSKGEDPVTSFGDVLLGTQNDEDGANEPTPEL